MAGGKRTLLVVGGLLAAFGVVGLAWSFASMHQCEVLAFVLLRKYQTENIQS